MNISLYTLYFAHVYFAETKFVETKFLCQSVHVFLILIDIANYSSWKFYELTFTPVLHTHSLV